MVNPKLLSESVTALGLQNPGFPASSKAEGRISPADSALYIGDLLENMRKIAVAQHLDVLAHLLELAWMETRIVAQDHKLNGTAKLRRTPSHSAMP
jgi:hypothetical protein